MSAFRTAWTRCNEAFAGYTWKTALYGALIVAGLRLSASNIASYYAETRPSIPVAEASLLLPGGLTPDEAKPSLYTLLLAVVADDEMLLPALSQRPEDLQGLSLADRQRLFALRAERDRRIDAIKAHPDYPVYRPGPCQPFDDHDVFIGEDAFTACLAVAKFRQDQRP